MKITFLVGYNVLSFWLWLKKLNGLKKRRTVRLITVEPRYNELYNEAFGITNDFLYPSNSKT